MYPEQHIKDCKKLWDAGVTKDWRSCKNWFSEDDVDFLIDYSDGTVYIAGDELEYIPVGGDRFTDHLVRWLIGRGYYLDPYFFGEISPNVPLQWRLMKHKDDIPHQYFEGTYPEALVQAVIWVLEQDN